MFNLPEIFIQADGCDFGFTFLLDEAKEHNYMHSACLRFFLRTDSADTEDVSTRIADIEERLAADPFSPDVSLNDMTLLLFNNCISKREDREPVECYDGKVRSCAAVDFTFRCDSGTNTDIGTNTADSTHTGGSTSTDDGSTYTSGTHTSGTHTGGTYTEKFYVDNTIPAAGILGRDFVRKHRM